MDDTGEGNCLEKLGHEQNEVVFIKDARSSEQNASSRGAACEKTTEQPLPPRPPSPLPFAQAVAFAAACDLSRFRLRRNVADDLWRSQGGERSSPLLSGLLKTPKCSITLIFTS